MEVVWNTERLSSSSTTTSTTPPPPPPPFLPLHVGLGESSVLRVQLSYPLLQLPEGEEVEIVARRKELIHSLNDGEVLLPLSVIVPHNVTELRQLALKTGHSHLFMLGHRH